MTEAQQRELVNAVERLTVAVQEIANRSWQALGTGESNRIVREVGALNMRLCDVFPYLRDSEGDAT